VRCAGLVLLILAAVKYKETSLKVE